MSSDGFFDEIEEPDLEAFDSKIDAQLPESYDKAETFDAFNEDTFGAPLEGDWESEHDKLLMLENENGFDGTLTKFDEFNGPEDYVEPKNTTKQSRENDQITVNNLNSITMPSDLKQNLTNEMQLKLFQQLQMQQQQQLWFQQQQLLKKNQMNQQYQSGSNSDPISPHMMLSQEQKNQLLQQQQSQFNSAMLSALMARNTQIQQNSTYNANMFPGQNLDRKTPVNLNSNLAENAKLTKEIFNNNNFNVNQQKNIDHLQSEISANFLGNTKNDENDSQKVKNFLEKMMPLPTGLQDNFNHKKESALRMQNEVNNPINMLAALQQQPNSNALPKLPSKIKTLEEIENELLASNQTNKTSSNEFNYQKNQTNKIDSSSQNNNLNKFFPMLNSHNTNQGLKSEEVMMKQKQNLDQLMLSQKQQQLQQQQQQNSMLNDQQHQLMLMQQQQATINSFIPPNFQSMNQHQKHLVLSQIQRNLQLSLMQQITSQGINNNRQINTDAQSIMNNDMNNNRYNESMKQRNNNNNSRNQMYNNQNRNMNSMNKNNKQNSRNNLSNGDKLVGMMTEKEKNWVTNVQMLQLQIDDPYRYDFYYTAWMLKKKQFSQRNTSSTGLKTSVIHTLDNKYNKDPKSYRPLTFENSLGKVTMSNFHHPRALIDVKSGEEPVDADLVSQIGELDLDDKNIDKEKNIDTILLEIEKMYQVLLSIDEIEHSILKANDEMRAILFQERRTKVDKLAVMLCTENFAHYLFVDKGKRLLSKCIPTFNLSQTKLILTFVMKYTYVIAKNNISLDEFYFHLSYAIDTQKFADLVEIVTTFVHLYSRQSTQLYHTIFTNKFCLSFLLKFFSKSDLISEDDFEIEQKNAWSCFLNLVLVGLTVVKPLSLNAEGKAVYNVCENLQINLAIVLENFNVNKEIWAKNEHKLKELFNYV